MYIEIITPDKIIFEGEIDSARIPGKKGSFQVLTDHAPIVSTLEKGIITIVQAGGKEITYNSDGGVVELSKNKIILLVEKISE